ncbi:MBL fold metallo-hydrolase [Treponema sp.]|uniref:MBL fold metallo-hydrolase n=1 Tax=Treponema sp. TaxID=166 RepID=UPI0025D0F5B3|nr:MBL fold metallo-hydrolase [Treponema sp.]MCR5218854.1 MBL fold metallo-hydrolase [Treponema sp.]
MYIKFYGVRGSLPAPVTPEQIQAKIAAVIERLTPEDLANEDTKTKFLSNLPNWLFGTTGGNTPCVEFRAKDGTEFIMDSGTGIRLLGKELPETKDNTYHLFLSHYHWDHIQGFPFFDKIYDHKVKLEIYSCFKDAETFMAGQNTLPYFPENAKWDNIKDHIHFNFLEEGKEYEINGIKIEAHKMTHPGDSYSFSFKEDGKKIIYSTDVELKNSDFDVKEKRNYFFKDADIIIFDCQYTNPEAIMKENWGHSSFSYAIDFAELWNIKSLYMFHHDPTYDDKKLDSILSAGKIYQNYKQNFIPELHLAQEGKVIEI